MSLQETVVLSVRVQPWEKLAFKRLSRERGYSQSELFSYLLSLEIPETEKAEMDRQAIAEYHAKVDALREAEGNLPTNWEAIEAGNWEYDPTVPEGGRLKNPDGPGKGYVAPGRVQTPEGA